jgi:hypothetical protein
VAEAASGGFGFAPNLLTPDSSLKRLEFSLGGRGCYKKKKSCVIQKILVVLLEFI